MKIGKTGWKTIAEENKLGGGLTVGYEAPASESLLRELQAKGIWVEVVSNKENSKGSKRLIRPDNKDKQVFTSDKCFRIISKNETYPAFEKMLSEKYGAPLPEDRFDEFVDWTNPKTWYKTGVNDTRGYYLDLTNVSDNKKWEIRTNLRQNLSPNAVKTKGNQLTISGLDWIGTLEFLWRIIARQKENRALGKKNIIDLGDMSEIVARDKRKNMR